MQLRFEYNNFISGSLIWSRAKRVGIFLTLLKTSAPKEGTIEGAPVMQDSTVYCATRISSLAFLLIKKEFEKDIKNVNILIIIMFSE